MPIKEFVDFNVLLSIVIRIWSLGSFNNLLDLDHFMHLITIDIYVYIYITHVIYIYMIYIYLYI